MQSFIEECLAGPGHRRLEAVLERVLSSPANHARFLNTLARLEYVGVRKMLKARRAEQLDVEGVQHILEEAVHALRLKKFALAVAPDPQTVATFSDAHTLAGAAAEDYFQSIDRAAALSVGDHPMADACYWLTSVVIEVRAATFYPSYQRLLKRRGLKVSVASIMQDETDHLERMASELPGQILNWQGAVTEVIRAEELHFCRFLDAIELELQAQGEALRN